MRRTGSQSSTRKTSTFNINSVVGGSAWAQRGGWNPFSATARDNGAKGRLEESESAEVEGARDESHADASATATAMQALDHADDTISLTPGDGKTQDASNKRQKLNNTTVSKQTCPKVTPLTNGPNIETIRVHAKVSGLLGCAGNTRSGVSRKEPTTTSL